MIFSTNLSDKNLIASFNLSNTNCYDNNTAYTITSNTFYRGYDLLSDNVIGYGKNLYSFGLTSSYTENKTLSITDRNLKFQQIGTKNNSGETVYLLTGITSGLTNSGDTYFNLAGSYLTTNFKYYGYNYELLPYRYLDGFTIETWLYTDQNTFDNITGFTDGFFLYFGARAENPNNIYYSGLTNITSSTYDINYLYDDIANNVIGIKLNKDKTISIRYLTTSAQTVEIKTDNSIKTGWTHFVMSYNPCQKIKDRPGDKINKYDLIDCFKRRDGDLNIYINGSLFYNYKEFPELFWYKNLNTSTENQVGLPYTISWGGGSSGLKNYQIQSATTITGLTVVESAMTFTALTSGGSVYEYTSTTMIVSSSYTAGTVYVVDNGFQFLDGDSGQFDLDINDLTSDIIDVVLEQDISLFYGGNASLKISNTTAGTSFITTNGNILRFTTPIIFENNTKYSAEAYLYDRDSFFNSDKRVYFDIPNLPSENKLTISRLDYNNSYSSNTWNRLYYEFEVQGLTSGTQTAFLELLTDNITPDFNSSFGFNIDNVTVNKYKKEAVVVPIDVEIQLTGYSITSSTIYDLFTPNFESKIAENFDGSFIGRIQMLNIYDKPLNFIEIKTLYNKKALDFELSKLK